jgi:hypothetical protein
MSYSEMQQNNRITDQFCTVMERENRQRGFVVSFGFSSTVKTFAAA